MPKPIIKHFVTEGTGTFPLEMLAFDQCWPARAADATAIAGSHLDAGAAAPLRKVFLATVAKYAPNRQRWIVAGWRVID